MHRTLLLAALAASPALAQTAYAIDTNLDILYTVDLTNGAVTMIGSTLNNGLDTAADLCWRDDTDELWTIDLSGGEVGTIDPATATFTPFFQTNLSGWQGMAWDHTEKKFWLHNQNDQLHVLDPATATTTLVGTLSPTTPLITALEIDGGGRLWGMDFSAGAVVELDKATGLEISRVSTPGLTNVQGFSIDDQGVWFAISTGTDSLYVVDPITGASGLIGPNTGTQFVKAFAITGSAVQRFGIACADGNSEVRHMDWSGSVAIGNTLMNSCEQGTVPMLAFAAYGFSSRQAGPFALPLAMAPYAAPGCTAYVSPDAVAGPMVTGTALTFVVPSDPGLVGLSLFEQFLILDSSATPNAAGLAFTDAIKLTITL